MRPPSSLSSSIAAPARAAGVAPMSRRTVPRPELADAKQQGGEMQAMRRTLEDLAKHCRGNARPECPILDDLARA